jgi:hypothetical protein
MSFLLYLIVGVIVIFIDGWAPTREPDEVIFRLGIGRVYLMEWLVYGLLAMYIFDWFMNSNPRKQRKLFAATPLDKPLLLFGLMLPAFGIYGLLRGNPFQAAFGYWEWRSLFLAIVFYFLCTSILDTSEKALRLFDWFLLLCAAKATYYLVFYLLGIPYPFEKIIGAGPFDEGPETMMFVFAALAAISLWLFRGESRTRLQSIAPWAALVLTANLAISAKRTVQIGLVLGLIVLGLHLPWRKLIRSASVAIVAAILFTTLLGIANSGSAATGVSASVSRYGEVLDFIQDPGRLSTPGETFAFHVLDLFDVWGEITQHPVLGTGFGSQYSRDLTLLPSVGGEGLGLEAGMVHDQYLYLWWKMGAVGLIAFLYLFGSILRFFKQATPSIPLSELEAISMGLYAAFCADVFMELLAPQWFASTKVAILILMCMAVGVCFARVKVRNTKDRPPLLATEGKS